MSIIRIVLILALLTLAYCFAKLAYMAPWVLVVAAVLLLAVSAKKGYTYLTAHGTARWASETDMRKAGLLDADTGLILGLAAYNPPSIFKAALGLFNRRIKAADACEAFVMAVRQFNRRKAEGPLVRIPKAIHVAVFAPSGAGKGVSVVIPFLLDSKESAIVIDPKGENYTLTHAARRKLGHKIVVIDPMRTVTQTPDSFDPVSLIDPESPKAIDDARSLANELAPPAPDDKNAYFTDSARAFIAAMISLVVYHGNPGMKSLQTVRSILSDPEMLQKGIAKLCESTACNGMLARIGKQLLFFKDKELSAVLSTAQRFLTFLDTPAIFENTSTTSFDPKELTTGKVTIYLVMPPEFLREKAALMRMWIGSFLRICVRGGLQEKHKIHFILDEAASLGHLESLDDAVNVLRGYGVRLTFIYQSRGQLTRCFPDGQDQTLLSNVTQVYFAVQDYQTAEAVSNLLGEGTILVESHGKNDGSSRSFDKDGAGSSGNSNGTSSNFSQEARKLLKPEEIIALPQRVAITLTPGCPPIWTNLVRFYEEAKPGWAKQLFHKLEIITAAVLLLGLCIGLAVKMTAVASNPKGVPNGSALLQGNGR